LKGGKGLMKILKTLPSVVLLSLFIIFSSAGVRAEAKEKKIDPEKDIKAHRIIRLSYRGGINQPELMVRPGTTVIWVNDSREYLEIKFEGEQVTKGCKSPVHFAVAEDGSFISDRIPQGSVASLCFVEKGTFNYVARKSFSGSISQYRDSFKEFKGTIKVE
jgi:hypothetical protein